MPKIQITSRGIRAALKKYTPYQSIAEYVWNGFDAGATSIEINYIADELGGLVSLSVKDNGYGIMHEKLQEKFEPMFESKKALENKLKQHRSALHGKKGIGRLTFFTFARSAVWNTIFEKDGKHFSYDIFANAENINFYTGISSTPKETVKGAGTEVTFNGVHSITAHSLGEKFIDFLCKEFAWFLELNRHNGFSIKINGAILDYDKLVAERENFEILYEKSNTSFTITYIRWNEKNANEPSRYYYLNSAGLEQWKEPTAIKNKGEQFHHSVFIKSDYFDSFAFQSFEENGQAALLGGSRSDAQFRFLRKKLANFLRIKRKPFLKSFAEKLIKEYSENGIISVSAEDRLVIIIKTLYAMQPRLFASLNKEQKKFIIGSMNAMIANGHEGDFIEIISSIIEITDDEKSELLTLLSK